MEINNTYHGSSVANRISLDFGTPNHSKHNSMNKNGSLVKMKKYMEKTPRIKRNKFMSYVNIGNLTQNKSAYK